MKDKNKTKDQLIKEIETLRRQVETWQPVKAEKESIQKRYSAQKYLEIASVILIVIDADQKVSLINKKGCEILGYKRREIIGKNWFDRFLPERIRKDVKTVFEKLISGKGIKQVEYFENPVLTKSGGERLIAWHNTILKDEKGKVTGTLSSGDDITDRKKAEEETLKAHREWENIFQAIGHPTIILDAAHNIISVNHATLKAIGVQSFEEIAGKKCFEIFHNAGEPPAGCPLVKMLESLELAAVEMEVEALGGIFLVSCTPVFDDRGNLQKVIHIATDITERKRVDENLRKNEERLKSIFRASPVGIGLVSSPERVLLQVNDYLCNMLGYSAEVLIGKSAKILYLADEDFEYVGREKYRQIREQGVGTVETRWKRRDGSILDVLLSSAPVDPSDFSRGITFTALDITERKRAGEALLESEKRFRTIFRNAADGILLANIRDKIFCDSNPSMCEMLGYTPEEIKGLSVYDIHPQEELPHVIEQFEKLARGEIKIALNIPVKKQDGSVFYADISSSPITMFGKEYVIGIFRDITERKRTEQEIRRLNEELEQKVIERTAEVQRVNEALHERALALEYTNMELEAFSYSVSHDLRAPLRHINGFVKLLNQRAGETLDGESRHYLKVIAGSAKSMSMLIDDLLAFSRIGRTEFMGAKFSLGKLVQEVLKDLDEEIKGRDIDWKIAELPEVYGDRSMIKLVLVNLLSNALKFTQARKPAKIEIGLTAGEREFTFSVRDNGVGFNMNYVDKLFGVFQRLHRKEEFEGTGIGLANVRRIITRHGGKTWAEGKLNKGATFYFTLPRKG